MTDEAPLHDRLLRANLERVFNERDAARRADAMAELYVAEPVMYEPDKVVAGREAIAAVAGALLEGFGPGFRFTPEKGPALGHHGMAVLRWHAGPEGSPAAISGADLAEIADGRIARLWVLLDPQWG
ncbi:nuclear transport factor 2 family protein [Belnapia sp. F-4-1]|uniref:nuclear transport factor 2 family protein n=1 Tax=Belnapia sp. F-4-1 TaxID=1545443 RepID=UPI0005BC0F0F|nr:nuclear transport factor 2 family protein [Belnapia sp. F-4-1]